MKTSLLGNCAKGNLHLPNSLAGAFLTFQNNTDIDKTTPKKKKSAKPMLFMKILPLSLSSKVVEN